MNPISKILSKIYLQKKSPVNSFHVCEKIRPIVKLHGISIKENEFIFPEYEEIYEIIKGSKKITSKQDCISFKDIVHLDESEIYVEIVVRSGFVYLLSKTKPERVYFNLFSITYNKN